jgi:glutathionylspermidine synthase
VGVQKDDRQSAQEGRDGIKKNAPLSATDARRVDASPGIDHRALQSDESAYYAFSLKEIEEDLEAPTAALDAMCDELVSRAVADDRIIRRLAIPEPFWDFHRDELEAPRRQPLRALLRRFSFSESG